MTTSKSTAHRLLSASLIAALGAAIAACGGDDEPTERPRADASTAPPSTSDASTATEDSSTPAPGATCEEQVYSELSPACKECTCATDKMTAPTCQKPCWDFMACSFKARGGPCMGLAQGSKELEACTDKECGYLLNLPGAQLISGYRTIIGACAVAPDAACAGDVGKFIGTLPPKP
jgi:hypothetical protein